MQDFPARYRIQRSSIQIPRPMLANIIATIKSDIFAKITELNGLGSISINASPGSCKRHEGANTSASGGFERDGNYTKHPRTSLDELLAGTVARKG